MAKLQHLVSILLILLMSNIAMSQSRYVLNIQPVDKSPAFIDQTLSLKKSFINRDECQLYINNLISSLQTKGYVTASIDSLTIDTTSAFIRLFIGEQYKWKTVSTSPESRQWLSHIGFEENQFAAQSFDYDQLASVQQRMLNYFENNGFPFAKIFMDSIQIQHNAVSGKLVVESGPLYHIDSIRVTGNAKISNDYLQNFLEIKNGSVYNKEKLQRISELLKKLNYIEETSAPQFYWGSLGGIVELFLDQKKSSQVNLIIGFLPNNDQLTDKKLLITGEGLLNLKNALGGGETIGLVWQRLAASSQRLNIAFQQPYLFKSPFGLDFSFDMLKRDSAFLNFEYKIGAQYMLNTQQSVKLFFSRFSTIVNEVNEDQVLQTRQLPDEADVKLSNLGLEYAINTTNYIFNPVDGLEIHFVASAGIKKITPNNKILELSDPEDPDFDFANLYDTVKTNSTQIRSILDAAKYFPLGKRHSTIKTALNGGWINGANIFRNELFQIGGYRLLRGFDEQSQYLSQYAIGTLEYRYLIGENSYLNAFADGGWGRDASRNIRKNYTYIGAGIGIAFETKAGIFNLAWAVGKRNDTEFNLRQSKIHFGFVNYF